MKLKVFAIYDLKVGSFMRPFFQVTVAQAARSFGDAVSDGQSEFHRHPEDYELYELGSFDDDEGKFENVEAQRVALGADFGAKGGADGGEK